MTPGGRTSNCSLGVLVDFYWHACPRTADHMEAALSALWAALQRPERRWNPWTSSMIKAELRDRLRVAAQGGLKPVDEVKRIGEGDVLFEIRWLDLAVTDVDGKGDLLHHATGLRLLHAEPLALSVCAVGLHAHEKPHSQDASVVREAQDREIDVALDRYHAGVGSLWNLRED